MNSEFDDAYERGMEGSAEKLPTTMFEERVRVLVNRQRPILVSPETTVRQTIEIMNQAGIGSALIGSEKQLLGIFSERDVMTRVVLSPAVLEQPVSSLMTANPECLPGDAQVSDAINLMISGGFRRVPVLDAWGKAIGVLSMRNCMQYIADQFPEAILNAAPFGHEFDVHREGA